jgi:metal-responsive CopG/Arc/MetJ family transcriptional regulator
MGDHRASKVTISLPAPLLDFADRLAQERATTRSGVIAGLLRQEEEAEIQALMAAGYQEMAEENQRLAEEAYPLVAETLLRSTRWDEQDGPEG